MGMGTKNRDDLEALNRQEVTSVPTLNNSVGKLPAKMFCKMKNAGYKVPANG